MNTELLHKNRLRNFLHSTLLLSAMLVLLAAVGSFFGMPGLAVGAVAALALITAGSRVSPHWILRFHRGRLLEPAAQPHLYRLLAELARRADLPRSPLLYRIPSPALNAFAVGNTRRAAIALTDGLLHSLAPRELAAVLAHEIGHIAHRDLWVMGLADMISRFTRMLSTVGQLVLILSLPWILLDQLQVPVLPLLILILAPGLSALLQLALSRTREFAADLRAAELTGDPNALASALTKLDLQSGGWLRRLFLPMARREAPAWLRTHPPTDERIARLRALKPPVPRSPLEALFGPSIRGVTPARRAPAAYGPRARIVRHRLGPRLLFS